MYYACYFVCHIFAICLAVFRSYSLVSFFLHLFILPNSIFLHVFAYAAKKLKFGMEQTMIEREILFERNRIERHHHVCLCVIHVIAYVIYVCIRHTNRMITNARTPNMVIAVA